MTPEPCSICGGKDVNLIDGFYYCVECGTQDTNAQHTIVEHTILADGTFAHVALKKITTVLKDALEMSGEWHKWHTFNFILSGLVDEMTALGTSPEFKTRVLWIWTKYIEKYANKEEMVATNGIKNKEDNKNTSKLFAFENEEDNNNKSSLHDGNEGESNNENRYKEEKSIKYVTKGLLLSILYVALNFDRSNIQLSHFCRFIREKRLSIQNYKKFIPKEMNLKSIPHWISFLNCSSDYTAMGIRGISMSLLKTLDLGAPMVPDLRKIVDNIVTELCLPDEFRNLVLSLMHKYPVDFLKCTTKKPNATLVRYPDFEGITMSYILVALKMSFGLDDEYEIKLSDAVDKINMDENRLKSYKLIMFSEPTDRLFSFREWCNYLKLRKTILCKYYLPMAQYYNLDVDDHVFMGQLEERPIIKSDLGDEVTMDILNKIQVKEEVSYIPRSEFGPSLTPMASYLEVILEYIQDTELKLLLSEDFTQYSLKYACENLELSIGGENIVKGVNEETKTISEVVLGNIESKEVDFSMVFVRNCENKNWLKTKPPTIEHISKIDENNSDREGDSNHGYDFNLENTPIETAADKSRIEVNNDTESEKILETVDEEAQDISIFDDNFHDVLQEERTSNDFENKSNEFYNENSLNDEGSFTEAAFNPSTFDREKTIKELILLACKKYKIPIPREYNEREPRRRPALGCDEAGVSKAKKRKIVNRAKPGQAKGEVNRILSAYYANLQKDLLIKTTENVRSFVDDLMRNENQQTSRFDDLSQINGIDNEDVCDHDKNYASNTNLEGETSDPENTAEDITPEKDPRFDEKIYDSKQLYVKFSKELNFENFFEFDDPEIDRILEKRIEESDIEYTKVSNKTQNDKGESKEERTTASKVKNRKLKLDYLIQNRRNITKYNYWFRHYCPRAMSRSRYIKEKFNMELKNNCSKSFEFIITECAALLDVTPFNLYKYMQDLETLMVP